MDVIVQRHTIAVLIGVIHSDFINCAFSSVCIDIRNDIGTDTHCILDSDLLGSADRYILSPSLSEHLFAIDIRSSEDCFNSEYKNPLWCIGFNNSMIELFPTTIHAEEQIFSDNLSYVSPSPNTTLTARLLIFEL